MRRSTRIGLAVALLVSAAGCAKPMVMIAPRIDLTQHEMIGIIEFDSTAKGKLGPFATMKFTEAARRDQGLVRIVSLGSEKEVLRSVGRNRLDAGTYQALGEKHNIRTILVGTVTVSDVRPNFQLAGLRSGTLSALVDATLATQMVETATGASIWNRSGSATTSVAQISVFGGKNFVFDADDPEQAYGGLVNTLVEHVTREFRVTWVRR